MIDGLHGTKEHPITLCGPTSAVFDGSDGKKLASASIRVVRSSHIRIKERQVRDNNRLLAGVVGSS